MKTKLRYFISGVTLTLIFHFINVWGINRQWELREYDHGVGEFRTNLLHNTPLKFYWRYPTKPENSTEVIRL